MTNSVLTTKTLFYMIVSVSEEGAGGAEKNAQNCFQYLLQKHDMITLGLLPGGIPYFAKMIIS
jgi:hypothetical protein